MSVTRRYCVERAACIELFLAPRLRIFLDLSYEISRNKDTLFGNFVILENVCHGRPTADACDLNKRLATAARRLLLQHMHGDDGRRGRINLHSTEAVCSYSILVRKPRAGAGA